MTFNILFECWLVYLLHILLYWFLFFLIFAFLTRSTFYILLWSKWVPMGMGNLSFSIQVCWRRNCDSHCLEQLCYADPDCKANISALYVYYELCAKECPRHPCIPYYLSVSMFLPLFPLKMQLLFDYKA